MIRQETTPSHFAARPNGCGAARQTQRLGGGAVGGALRAAAFRALKAPLLARYAVAWHWPRTVDLRRWERGAFTSASGARLAALFAPATGERRGIVVCAHPLRRDAKGFFLSTGRAELLLRNGFDVLLFDFNGFGESGCGDFRYVEDVLAAAAYARTRAPGLPVHALAACFGAVWTLCAAAAHDAFDSIVLESPLTSMQEYFAADAVKSAAFALLWRLFPASAANATPQHAVRALRGTPRIFFVAGTDDRVATTRMAQRLHDACSVPLHARAIWHVAGAAHLRAFETQREGYEERVIGFLAEAPCSAQRVW